jgi:hypothetical protein
MGPHRRAKHGRDATCSQPPLLEFRPEAGPGTSKHDCAEELRPLHSWGGLVVWVARGGMLPVAPGSDEQTRLRSPDLWRSRYAVWTRNPGGQGPVIASSCGRRRAPAARVQPPRGGSLAPEEGRSGQPGLAAWTAKRWVELASRVSGKWEHLRRNCSSSNCCKHASQLAACLRSERPIARPLGHARASEHMEFGSFFPARAPHMDADVLHREGCGRCGAAGVRRSAASPRGWRARSLGMRGSLAAEHGEHVHPRYMRECPPRRSRLNTPLHQRRCSEWVVPRPPTPHGALAQIRQASRALAPGDQALSRAVRLASRTPPSNTHLHAPGPHGAPRQHAPRSARPRAPAWVDHTLDQDRVAFAFLHSHVSSLSQEHTAQTTFERSSRKLSI